MYGAVIAPREQIQVNEEKKFYKRTMCEQTSHIYQCCKLCKHTQRQIVEKLERRRERAKPLPNYYKHTWITEHIILHDIDLPSM